jgi:transposase
MVSGLVAGKSISELLSMARGSLKNKREDLAASLEGDLLPRHLYILTELHESVTILEQKFARLDAYLIEAMRPYQWAVELLQTIPGIDATSPCVRIVVASNFKK